MSVDKRKLFLERSSQILGLNPAEVEEIFSQERISSFRVNSLKVSDTEKLVKTISALTELKEIPWAPSCYWIEGPKDTVTKSSFFEGGLVTLQNASSLIPPLALDPELNSSILDTCSSPGMKASHVASLVQNKVELVVNEPDKRRASALCRNLDHLGVTYSTLNVPAQFLNHRTDRKFDYILVDAPCSGEGMIDLRGKDPLKFWNLKKVTALSKLQKRILLTALDLLKPGGTLVYSTCTISPEENEGVIDYVLSRIEGVRVEEIPLPITNRMPSVLSWQGTNYKEDLSKAVRIKPNKYMEAFFVCKLKKN